MLARARLANPSASSLPPIRQLNNSLREYEDIVASQEVRDLTSILLDLKTLQIAKLLRNYPSGRLPYATIDEFNIFLRPEQVSLSVHVVELA